MRRVIVIAAAIVGAVVIFAGAILFYAATNLNSIIAERRQTVLDKVSRALGRQVHADDIKVSLGWGILADVTGVQVADDPDISNKPFIEASNVYTRLELIPLLARRIQVTEVVLDKPVIRIVQTRDGTLNVSTLGRKRVHSEEESGEGGGKGGGGWRRRPYEESPMAEAGRAPAALGSLYVQNFTVNDGTLEFITEGAPQAATVNNIDLKVRDFGFQAPFTIALNFAALSDQQNFDLSATIGPLINGGVIDIDAIPLKGTAKVGPIQAVAAGDAPDDCEVDPAEALDFRSGQFRRYRRWHDSIGQVQRLERPERAGDCLRRRIQQACRPAAEDFRRGNANSSRRGTHARQRNARRPRC